MTRFVPREKMGKKARRALDARQRRTWPFSPVTRKAESRKHYDRKRRSREAEALFMGFFFLAFSGTHLPRTVPGPGFCAGRDGLSLAASEKNRGKPA